MPGSDVNSAAGGIQSVDVALRIVVKLAHLNGPVSLTDLARACDLAPSKVHRYLASFVAAGMVTQSGRSGKYDLGPAALELGLAAMARLDFVNRCSDAMPDLRDATGMTALLSVWGSQGATVVRWEKAPAPVITSMGLGTSLPLLTSASGRVFLSYAAPGTIESKLTEELNFSDIDFSDIDVDLLRNETRRLGYSTVDGYFIPGLVACAAPVLDWQGYVQCVITLIGTDAKAIAKNAKPIKLLTDFCREFSISAPVLEINTSKAS